MQNVEFNNFTEVNEATHPEKLKPNELAQLDNMVIDDQLGIISTRKGFARYLQPDSTGVINNLFDVQDANQNNYLLANVGTKLRKYFSSTWTDIKTGLTAAKMRMAAYGSSFIFTNGVDKPFYMNSAVTMITGASVGSGIVLVHAVAHGLSSGTSVAITGVVGMTQLNATFVVTVTDSDHFTVPLVTIQTYISGGVISKLADNLFIDRPIVTGIMGVLDSSSSVLPLDSQYILVYVASDGQKSNASDIFRIFDFSATYYASVTLNNLPISSDSRVVSKMLFRTKEGIYSNYFLVCTLDNSVTTYIDTIPDTSLDSSETIEYLNTPQSAKYIISSGDRITLANISKMMTNRIISPVFVYDYGITIGHPGIFSSETSGSMAAGVYKYAITFVDVNGNESDIIPYFTHTLVSSGIIFILFDYPLTSLTLGVGSFIEGITKIRIYRTKVNGSSYFWSSDFLITNYVGISDITDIANDTTLTVAYPKSLHNNLEIQVLPSSVIYSNLYNYLEYPELNYLEVFPDDSDSITGIFDDDNGIMVFKENSICKIYTNGSPENWQIVKLVHNIGCDQPDSIFKYGNTYFFVFRNKVYEWAGSGEPKCISYKRKPTFDSVTSFQGAAFYNSVLWYVLTVKISSTYYLLCYDTKLETWYKFSINQADTVLEKVFGTDKGKLLFGGNLYITYYSDQAYDTDSGTTQDITIALKTKDYSFPDNFITARLMFLMINYYRLIGTVSKQITFALTDPVSGISISLTDWDETIAQNIFKIVTDGMQGDLKRTFKINLSISGEAISKFFAGRLDYNVEQWRVLQKTLVHTATDDSGKFATDDTDRPASDDGGGISVF
jgi:hypothetical protein